MAFAWSSFYAGLRAAIGAVWTEIPAKGIYTATRAESLSFERLAVPLVILQPGTAQEADWGMGNAAYEIPISIHYVMKQTAPPSADHEDTVAAKLEALEDYLLTTGIATGQVLWVQGIDTTEAHPVNQLCIAKKLPYFAGGLTVRCLVGEVALA